MTSHEGVAILRPSMRLPWVYATVAYWQPREVELVQRCVASLLAQDTDDVLQLHVIVVDNGCGLTPRLPDPARVELMRLDRNRGFTGGHNLAMRKALAAGADYVFLVNSDAVVDPACVRHLVEVAESHPAAGLIGPLVLHEHRPDRVESAGQAFNAWTARHRELGKNTSARALDGSPRVVDAVSGCAVLARRAVLEMVGLLDESLFAYFEDMDWCLRARAHGFSVLVAPRARVWHRGGASTAGSPLITYYSVRNHMRVGRRHARGITRWLVPLLVAGYHAAFLLVNRERRTRPHARAFVHGVRAALGMAPPPRPRLASSH